jgi:NADH-quinone oxidoreductase subunit C
MALSNEQIITFLQEQFPSDILGIENPYGLLSIEINPAKNVEIIQALKDNEEFDFIFLTDLCGVHFPDNKGKEVGVVYHLHSLVHNFRLRLKAFMPESNTEINTLTSLYASANWMERETYDFYGIRFIVHPDMRRILNVDHMEMFPLLKQYPLEDSSRTDKDDRFFGR